MQIEYGGAYFLDDGVQVVDASAQPLLHLAERARGMVPCNASPTAKSR